MFYPITSRAVRRRKDELVHLAASTPVAGAWTKPPISPRDKRIP